MFGKVWQQQCVSCDWLTCVCDTDSPQDTPLVKTCHHLLKFSPSTLSLFMFTQDGQLETEAWRKDWATWGGEAEPWRINFFLDAVLRWSCMQCGWSTTQGRMKHMRDCRIRKGSVIGILSLQGQEENHWENQYAKRRLVMEILAYLFHRSHVPWQKMGNVKTGL